MLVLSRKLNETIVIGDNVRVTLLGIDGDKIRCSIYSIFFTFLLVLFFSFLINQMILSERQVLVRLYSLSLREVLL